MLYYSLDGPDEGITGLNFERNDIDKRQMELLHEVMEKTFSYTPMKGRVFDENLKLLTLNFASTPKFFPKMLPQLRGIIEMAASLDESGGTTPMDALILNDNSMGKAYVFDVVIMMMTDLQLH